MSDNRNEPMSVQLDAGTHYLCTCGQSKSAPFCDGSHQGSEYAPHEAVIAEAKTVYLCRCGKTGDSPFCDGTHTTL